jgi:hypothetical protein
VDLASCDAGIMSKKW